MIGDGQQFIQAAQPRVGGSEARAFEDDRIFRRQIVEIRAVILPGAINNDAVIATSNAISAPSVRAIICLSNDENTAESFRSGTVINSALCLNEQADN